MVKAATASPARERVFHRQRRLSGQGWLHQPGRQPDRERKMRQQYERRHGRDGRASANYQINEKDKAEVRLSIALGSGRFNHIGLSVTQAIAIVEALTAALHDGEHHWRGKLGDGGR